MYTYADRVYTNGVISIRTYSEILDVMRVNYLKYTINSVRGIPMDTNTMILRYAMHRAVGAVSLNAPIFSASYFFQRKSLGE